MESDHILRAATLLREHAAELMRSECVYSGDELVWPDGTEATQSACNEMIGLAAELEAVAEEVKTQAEFAQVRRYRPYT